MSVAGGEQWQRWWRRRQAAAAGEEQALRGKGAAGCGDRDALCSLGWPPSRADPQRLHSRTQAHLGA